MPTWIYVILIVVIIQRLGELLIARHNEKALKNEGAIEIGEKHYKWFIMVHVGFFIVLLLEMELLGHINPVINLYLFTFFLLTQAARIWCITSLGKYWNTKIIILPNATLVKNGPYKYISHPNYIIVGIELCIIPLLFGAYITAFVFPLLHILLLTIRIPIENQALQSVSQYSSTSTE